MTTVLERLEEQKRRRNANGKGGKLSPPRVGMDPKDVKWDDVNAPEHNEKKELETSHAIEKLPRGEHQKVAEAAASGGDPTKVASDAKALIEARKAQSAEVVLERVKNGQGAFTKLPKEATVDCPYVHMKTLNVLKKKELINYRKNDDGTYTVRLPATAESVAAKTETAVPGTVPPVKPANVTGDTDIVISDGAQNRVSDGVQKVHPLDDADLREVFMRLAELTDGDPEKTIKLFDAFDKRFGA